MPKVYRSNPPPKSGGIDNNPVTVGLLGDPIPTPTQAMPTMWNRYGFRVLVDVPMSELTSDEIRNFTKEYLAVLSTRDIKDITPDIISLISPKAIPGLSIKDLLPDTFEAISVEQIKELTTVQIQNITSGQASVITEEQIAAFTSAQIT